MKLNVGVIFGGRSLEHEMSIISAIQAMGYAKKSLNGTIIGVLSRTIFLIIFAYFNNGIYSLIYALSLSIIITTIYDIKVLKNIIKKGS